MVHIFGLVDFAILDLMAPPPLLSFLATNVVVSCNKYIDHSHECINTKLQF